LSALGWCLQGFSGVFAGRGVGGGGKRRCFCQHEWSHMCMLQCSLGTPLFLCAAALPLTHAAVPPCITMRPPCMLPVPQGAAGFVVCGLLSVHAAASIQQQAWLLLLDVSLIMCIATSRSSYTRWRNGGGCSMAFCAWQQQQQHHQQLWLCFAWLPCCLQHSSMASWCGQLCPGLQRWDLLHCAQLRSAGWPWGVKHTCLAVGAGRHLCCVVLLHATWVDPMDVQSGHMVVFCCCTTCPPSVWQYSCGGVLLNAALVCSIMVATHRARHSTCVWYCSQSAACCAVACLAGSVRLEHCCGACWYAGCSSGCGQRV
jgi:hypothetical protein